MGTRPHPAVAAVRLAVRRALSSLPQASTAGGRGGSSPQASTAGGRGEAALVLVACSGGPDSLALAAAVAFEAPKLGLRAGAITVDRDQARRVEARLCQLGLDPVHLVAVAVTNRESGPDYPGPEAAARRARYAAFHAVRVQTGAVAILLGHTMDDQAETVLLGLARGSGARSIAGMAPVTGSYLRPLLGLRRAQTIAACAALDLVPWQDPQNSDVAFARIRVRTRILPVMEELIGPGVTESLARTADQLRADADALDELTASVAEPLLSGPSFGSPTSPRPSGPGCSSGPR